VIPVSEERREVGMVVWSGGRGRSQ